MVVRWCVGCSSVDGLANSPLLWFPNSEGAIVSSCQLSRFLKPGPTALRMVILRCSSMPLLPCLDSPQSWISHSVATRLNAEGSSQKELWSQLAGAALCDLLDSPYIADRQPSHVFCNECSDALGLTAAAGGQRLCPACQTVLTQPDDAVSTSLQPTEDYKTSVLSGLSPSTIMECAGRGLAFWSYQSTQEMWVVNCYYHHRSTKIY